MDVKKMFADLVGGDDDEVEKPVDFGEVVQEMDAVEEEETTDEMWDRVAAEEGAIVLEVVKVPQYKKINGEPTTQVDAALERLERLWAKGRRGLNPHCLKMLRQAIEILRD